MRKAMSFLFALCVGIPLLLQAQDGIPYRIYNNKGKDLEFKKAAALASEAEVVLFGEFHDNSIVHWLQLQLLKNLGETWKDDFAVGAEMFERDDQLIIDEFLSGTIQMKHLEKEAKLWPNFKTDYQPMLEYCKERGVPFIATNVPRRYAALVAKEGMEALERLSDEAKNYIAPLPIDLDSTDQGYKEMLSMDMGHRMGAKIGLIVKAQALKDATMARSIVDALKDKKHVLHFNGDFHSKNYSGIYRYVEQYRQGTRQLTIAVVEGDPETFEESYKNLADLILVVPADMCKTH